MSDDNVPEGCTPADAAMLRRANHAFTSDRHQLIELIRELCPEGIEQACDECGGDDSECSKFCPYRKARAILALENAAE